MGLFDSRKEVKSIRLLKKLQEEADLEWENEKQNRKQQELKDQEMARTLQAELEAENKQSRHSPPSIPAKPKAYDSLNNRKSMPITPLPRATVPPIKPLYSLSPSENRNNQRKSYLPQSSINLSTPGPSYASVFNDNNNHSPVKESHSQNNKHPPVKENHPQNGKHSPVKENHPQNGKHSPVKENHQSNNKHSPGKENYQQNNGYNFYGNSNANASTQSIVMPMPSATNYTYPSQNREPFMLTLSQPQPFNNVPSNYNNNQYPPSNCYPPAPILLQPVNSNNTTQMYPPPTNNTHFTNQVPIAQTTYSHQPPITQTMSNHPSSSIKQTTHNDNYVEKKLRYSDSVLSLKPNLEDHNNANQQLRPSTSTIKKEEIQVQEDSDDDSKYDYSDMIYDRRQESRIEGDDDDDDDNNEQWEDAVVDPFADNISVDLHSTSTATSATIIDDLIKNLQSTKIEPKPAKMTINTSFEILDPTHKLMQNNFGEGDMYIGKTRQHEEKESNEVETTTPYGNRQFNENVAPPFQSPTPPFQSPKSPFQVPPTPFQPPSTPFQPPPTPFQPISTHFQPPPTPFQPPPTPFQPPPTPFQPPATPFQPSSTPFNPPPTPFQPPPTPFQPISTPLNGQYPSFDESNSPEHKARNINGTSTNRSSQANPYQNNRSSFKPVPADDYGYFNEGDKSNGNMPPPTNEGDRHITVASINPGQKVWIRIHPIDTGRSLAERIGNVASYRTRRVTKITTRQGKSIPLDNTPLFNDWEAVLNFQDGELWKIEWIPIDTLVDAVNEGMGFIQQFKANFFNSNNNNND